MTMKFCLGGIVGHAFQQRIINRYSGNIADALCQKTTLIVSTLTVTSNGEWNRHYPVYPPKKVSLFHQMFGHTPAHENSHPAIPLIFYSINESAVWAVR